MLLAPRDRRRNRHLRPDGRTLHARRYKQLLREFSAEIGAPLSAIDEALIGQAAALVVKAEVLQTEIVAGRASDSDEIVRLASESRRILESLKSRSVKNKPTGPSLADHLRAKYGAGVPADAEAGGA